jgi:hypothetical protein
MEHAVTTTASANNSPWSPTGLKAMPRRVRWKRIALPLAAKAMAAPTVVVLGMNRRIDAISSKMPEAILPQASAPSVEKI